MKSLVDEKSSDRKCAIFVLRGDLTIRCGLTTMFRWPQRETDSV